MKFTCLQENLLKGLNIARQSSSRATTLPVLQTFLLQGKQGSLTISSTNLEIGIRVHIRGKEDSEGAICIPQDTLLAYIRNLPQDKLNLNVDNDELTIEQGEDIQAQFKGIIAEDFPNLPEIEVENQIVINSNALKQGLKSVYGSLPKNEFRPEISGVYLAKKDHQLIFVGTDGFRLSEKKFNLDNLDGDNFSVIIPSKTVSEIIRVLDALEETDVNIQFGSSQIKIIADTVEIVSKLIDGNFPQYEGLIPQNFSTNFDCDSQELVQAIKLASVFSQNTVNDVKLNLEDDKNLNISSSDSQIGANKTKIPVNINGETGLNITFNYNYLLDGIQLFKDGLIQFNLNDTDSPVILKSNDTPDFYYLIMPIRD
ncbi:MAG: DNA polymerase III subunit beta [Candidatus Paceibacterota bacterium]